jgi:hypothetical protein
LYQVARLYTDASGNTPSNTGVGNTTKPGSDPIAVHLEKGREAGVA